MKKILLTLAAVAAASCATYGQGVMTFASSVGIFDDFTTPGTPTKDGNMYVDLIWMAGSGNTFSDFSGGATAAGTLTSSPWSDLNALSADGASGTGSTWGLFSGSELAQTLHTSPPIYGTYSDNTITFGSVAGGSVISMYVIAWNDAYSTVSAAAQAGAPIGWSGEINYTLGTSTSPGAPLGAAGSGFDVDDIAATPEPTTLALAGLGGLSMLFLRRRKA